MLKAKRLLYPDNWEEIAAEIKLSADWRCEECDRDCRKPGEGLHEFAERIVGTEQPRKIVDSLSTFEQALVEVLLYPGCWVLTTSHTDQRPENCEPGNLRALCAPCHLRYDAARSRRAARERIAAERAGQLSIIFPGPVKKMTPEKLV